MTSKTASPHCSNLCTKSHSASFPSHAPSHVYAPSPCSGSSYAHSGLSSEVCHEPPPGVFIPLSSLIFRQLRGGTAWARVGRSFSAQAGSLLRTAPPARMTLARALGAAGGFPGSWSFLPRCPLLRSFLRCAACVCSGGPRRDGPRFRPRGWRQCQMTVICPS